MRINSRHYRTIWENADGSVEAIDQTKLPHRFETRAARLARRRRRRDRDHGRARRAAHRRDRRLWAGARRRRRSGDEAIEAAHARLAAARPTAVNLRWALDRLRAAAALRRRPPSGARSPSARPAAIADEDALCCEAIGDHGATLICAAAAEHPGRPVNILTHCNAGWLAAVDWGTALAPIYKAARDGVDLHVWVDETRPRNQGASLTAFELSGEGDSAYGHRRQYRRPSDAARARRSLHRRQRPHDAARRCLQQDRHLSEGARRP